jgi:hypothetical protein
VLGIGQELCSGSVRTLCSAHPIESMIEIVRDTQRNVKRWGR